MEWVGKLEGCFACLEGLGGFISHRDVVNELYALPFVLVPGGGVERGVLSQVSSREIYSDKEANQLESSYLDSD